MAHTQIQIMSDLHLETPSTYDIYEITPEALYLALLGDIGYVKDEGFLLFLRKQLAAFKIVFLVLGNHEPYHSTWTEAKARIRRFKGEIADSAGSNKDKALGELVLLDQTRYDISPDVTILGCTLFSHVTQEQYEHVSFGLNDFYRIDDWTVEGHNGAHAADVAWLNKQVELISRLEPERRIAIFTHHAPCSDIDRIDPDIQIVISLLGL